MASKKGISAQRLKTILNRQSDCNWDSTYEPSILATTQEAPSISRAYTLNSKRLGREIHLLSTPERNATLLGLYHPNIIGLQEQRMLSLEPALHPLWQMPNVNRTNLPSFTGVVEVAEKLGLIDLLPMVNCVLTNGEKVVTYFPWIGDLLWAVRKQNGQIFALNWSIKSDYEDFKRSLFLQKKTRANNILSTGLMERHQIEKYYYIDANIRTHFVSDQLFDKNVIANLRQLFLHHATIITLPDELEVEIFESFKLAFEAGIAPSQVIKKFVENQKVSPFECRDILYQAIWNRELRVDLFKPILVNIPLRHEKNDVVDVYQELFQGLK